MSALVEADGAVTSLDGKASPDEVVTEDDAKDAGKLARLLARILKDIATAKRRWAPRRLVVKDFVSTGTAITPVKLRIEHKFGGRVVWWLGDWSAAAAPLVRRSTATGLNTNDLLTLEFSNAGTATVIVEEAG